MWVSKNQCHYLGVMHACGGHMAGGRLSFIYLLTDNSNKEHSIMTMLSIIMCGCFAQQREG